MNFEERSADEDLPALREEIGKNASLKEIYVSPVPERA